MASATLPASIAASGPSQGTVSHSQAPAADAGAPLTAVFLDGEDEWLMGDRAVTVTPPAGSVWAVWELPLDLGRGWVSVIGPEGAGPTETFDVRFAAPTGEVLQVGRYEQLGFRDATHASLKVMAGSSSCGALDGWFEIFELERDADGRITRLALDFERRCSVGDPVLYGSVRLAATTPLAAVGYSPVAIDHGEVDLDTQGNPVDVTVTNTGTVPQAIVPRIEGPGAGQFRIADTTCQAELPAGGTCTVTVRFAPVTKGAATADLILADGTARGWREIDLTGMGLASTVTAITVGAVSSFPTLFSIDVSVTPRPTGGHVRIYDGDTLLADLSAPAGDIPSVTLQAALAPGAHALSARYVHLAPYQDSRSDVVAHVASLGSAVTLEASPSTAAPGEDVRLFATVDVAGPALASAGTLTVTDRTTGEELARLAVAEGATELRAVALDAAGHTISASYSGAGEVSSSSMEVVIPSADTRPPVATIQLGSGAAASLQANVYAVIEAEDPAPSSGIDAVRLSEDGTTWEAWSLFASEPFWTHTTRWWTFGGPDGPRRLYAQVRDVAGNVSTSVFDDIVIDRAAPAERVPTASLASGGTVGNTTAPVAIGYGTTDTLSGVADYRLDGRVGSGGWTGVGISDGSTQVVRSLAAAWTTHTFRTSAADVAGNWNEPRSGSPFTLAIVQDSSRAVRYGSGWVRRTPAWASGTSVRRTTRIGATARVEVTGRAIGIVAATGRDCGRIAVYLDGTRVATVDLRSTTTRPRRLVHVLRTSGGRHTVLTRTITPSRASDGSRVDLDAVVVLR